MSTRPKSSCTVIGRWWVQITGKLPPFEQCCVEHDADYSAESQGYLAQEIELAREEGWSRRYFDLKFKRCIETKYTRQSWWDEICYLGVRHFGWLFWTRTKTNR